MGILPMTGHGRGPAQPGQAARATRFASKRQAPCDFTQIMWVEPRLVRGDAPLNRGQLGVLRPFGITAGVALEEAIADNLDEFF